MKKLTIILLSIILLQTAVIIYLWNCAGVLYDLMGQGGL